MTNMFKRKFDDIENAINTPFNQFKKRRLISNVIVYCRLSSKGQNIMSLEHQEFNCITYCSNNNMNVLNTVKEVSSARVFQKLKKLNNIIKQHNNITIIVQSVDRFCRNTRDALNILEVLKTKNINLISITDNINLKTAYGRHAFRLLLSNAELKSDIISENVNNSLNYRKQRGDYIGNVGYGYKITIDENGIRRKIIDKNQKKIIKFIHKFLYRIHTSTNFTKDLFDICKIYNKQEDVFVDVVFCNDNIPISKDNYMLINVNMIRDVLNEYDIPCKTKLWTSNNIKHIYNTQLKSFNLNIN